MTAYLIKGFYGNLPVILMSVTVILLAGLLIYVLVRLHREYDMLDKMLDSAIEGNFQEKRFDEFMLSRLESKLYQFLSSSSLGRKKVEEERGKEEELIANISHQTKTPIANLMLYSELLSEEELTPQMRSNVEAIRQQSEKLRFLIDSLVKLSRLENGILTLSPHPQPLQPLLDEIAAQYTRKAGEKGLTLTVLPTAAAADFDGKWIAEALGNLVDNAIKYTESGSICVGVQLYELFARVDVTDTGIGIAEAEQPKIFSRFYRSQAVCEEEGVGIGLYLARKIISDQGGYIKLRSEVGIGSTFSVFLPRSAQIL